MRTVRLIIGILSILIGSVVSLGVAMEFLEGSSEYSLATDIITVALLGIGPIVGGVLLIRRATSKEGESGTAPRAIPEFQERKYFRTTVLPAILIAVAWNMAFIWQQLVEPQYTVTDALSWSILMTAYSSFVVYALHRMANGKVVEGLPRYFGVWGFTWRFLIVEYSAFFVFVLLLVVTWILLRRDFSAIHPSMSFSIVSTAACTLISPAMIWLFFSKNRRLQLHWFLGLFSVG